MQDRLAIGIDLGTSTSEICVYRNGEPFVVPSPSSQTRSPIFPSLVAVNKRGELVVGEDARPYVDLPGCGVREIKRKMGSGETVALSNKQYRPEEISALILRKLRENAEESLGIKVRPVVLSVPANFPDAARQATLAAGELAGLEVVRLINEPTAAALAFGINNIDAEEQLVVFDFGGGTLDITVLEMMAGVLDVKCSFGDPALGGKDFDEIIVNLILRKFEKTAPGAKISDRSKLSLKDMAERTKVSLSSQRCYPVQIPNFAVRAGEPIDLEVEITREELEHAVSPLLDRARECVRQALNAKKVRPSAVDRVLLVGGTTFIPCVRRLVAEMFGKEPKADVNPDLAVAIGAAIQAALAQGIIDAENGIILTDVAPFGLGIPVVNSGNGGPMTTYYDPLIQPNTTVPYSYKKLYSLLTTTQTEVEVHLYQDHKGTARLPCDAVDTGILATIRDIPQSTSGAPHPVEVSFSYDINGLVKITASIPTTGQTVDLEYRPNAKRLTDEQKQESLSRVEELWRSSPRAKQYEALIGKARQLLETLPAEKRGGLDMALSELQDALAANDANAIDRTGDRLTDLMFDLENQF